MIMDKKTLLGSHSYSSNGRWKSKKKMTMERKENLEGLTAGQCGLPITGDGKVKWRWNGKLNLHVFTITAAQCELPLLGNGKKMRMERKTKFTKVSLLAIVSFARNGRWKGKMSMERKTKPTWVSTEKKI
jgi:hypothetical protein